MNMTRSVKCDMLYENGADEYDMISEYIIYVMKTV